MDYTLDSLAGAFDRAKYAHKKQGYKVFATLLATSLDQQFVLEYLSHYHELDALTGSRILVFGPTLVKAGNSHWDAGRGKRIWTSDLPYIRQLTTHKEGSPVPWHDRNVAEHFIRFMHDLTAESYTFARYIGLRTDHLPALVFFETLDEPRNFVIWKLLGKSAEHFIRDFRTLVEELYEKCHWRIEDRINGLQTELSDTMRLPYDVEQARQKYLRAQQSHFGLKLILDFYPSVRDLRIAYDQVKSDPEVRIPLENIGKTLELLEGGIIHYGSFEHLRRHRKRWKSRMPSYYRKAIDKVYRLSDIAAQGSIMLTEKEAASRFNQSFTSVERLKFDSEELERNYRTRVQEELDAARIMWAQPGAGPLQTVREFLGDAADLQLDATNIFECVKGSSDQASDIPRVFISYSHDSEQHKKLVLKLAQRLRSDGIDCWIDQFETSPTQGFPRWMQQQILHADFVLVVCSAQYRRRFEGIEERGKGAGVNFEGYLILQDLYDNSMQNNKYIPIFLEGQDARYIPEVLHGRKSYTVAEGYELLLQHLFSKPAVVPRPIGRPPFQ